MVLKQIKLYENIELNYYNLTNSINVKHILFVSPEGVIMISNDRDCH